MDANQKSYVCLHVFNGEKPILLVSRPGGDLCFLCGDGHPEVGAPYRVAGVGCVVDQDPSVAEVLDLPRDWDAERTAVGDPWRLQPIPEEERER